MKYNKLFRNLQEETTSSISSNMFEERSGTEEKPGDDFFKQYRVTSIQQVAHFFIKNKNAKEKQSIVVREIVLLKPKKTLDSFYHIQIENTYRYLGSIYEYKNPITNINIRPL